MGSRIVPALGNKASFTSFLLLALVLLLSPVLFGSIHDASVLTWAFILGFSLFLFPSTPFHAVSQLPASVFYPMLALPVWMLLQSFFAAADQDAARIETIKTVSYGILFCLVIAQPLERAEKLSRGLMAAACLITLYGWIETGSGHESVLWRHKEAHTGYVTGVFMNRNHFAGFLELALGLSAALFFEDKERKKRFLKDCDLVAICFLTAGLFASGSRSGILSFFIGTVVFMAFYLKNIPKRARWTAAAAALCLIMAAVFAAGKTGVLRYFDAEETFSLFHSERWLVWQDTLKLFMRSPWGIGPGHFEALFPSVQSEKLIFEWGHAHNGYLELLAELGLPGFLLLAAGWLGLWNVWRRGWKALPQTSRITVLAALCGFGAFLLHGISDFNFSIPSNMFLFSFLAAFVTVRIKAS